MHWQEQRNKNFTEWRKGQADIMPGLALRVFALRDRVYDGYGFHYAMEKLLGSVLRQLNNFTNIDYYHSADAIAHQITLFILTKELYEAIVKAEGSAEEIRRFGNKT